MKACQTRSLGLWQWLTCWLCWEVKIGVTLLLLSSALFFWEALPLPAWRWQLGWISYWVGVGCLVYGLGRDLIIMAKAVAAWYHRRHTH